MKRKTLTGLIACILLEGTLIKCKHDPFSIDEPDPTPYIACGEIDTVENINTPCHEDSIYFQNHVLPILLTRCALSGCHDIESQQGDFVLCSYEGIMYPGDIVPYNTHEGELIELITSTDPDHIMPPPPNQPIPSTDIDIILQWVQQGALNNKCNE